MFEVECASCKAILHKCSTLDLVEDYAALHKEAGCTACDNKKATVWYYFNGQQHKCLAGFIYHGMLDQAKN